MKLQQELLVCKTLMGTPTKLLHVNPLLVYSVPIINMTRQ